LSTIGIVRLICKTNEIPNRREAEHKKKEKMKTMEKTKMT